MSKKGLSIPPYFTNGQLAEKLFNWHKVDCQIKDRQGQVHFAMSSVEAPQKWSQLAVEIAASKYFRKQSHINKKMKPEKSLRQLVERVTQAITSSGLKQKYFADKKQAQIFKEELKYLLLSQRAAFNSPVWFNVGIYEKPQCSACFIQSVDDSIEGIFELAKTEARLFKYGSGTGTNFSSLRSKYEEIETGGTSSGLISFLEVLDRGAGAIKSGGTTRRAAKMVCVDVDHPEILDFIDWKMNEEKKAHALIAAGYSADLDGVAYKSVAGQNANNSVRLSDQFLKAVKNNQEWSLKARVTHQTIQKIPAQQVWDRIVKSAWTCADPGLQFNDTINKWHTCADTTEIRASNPCSEYMFIDNSACNLASINLSLYLDEDGDFDLPSYLHTIRLLIIAQDILVDMAGYPTELIAENSHDYRTLGLGFANLGSLLMRKGIPYDSDEGRAWAGFLSSLMTGMAYLTSSALASQRKAFTQYQKNKKSMLRVMGQHQKSLQKIPWIYLPQEFQELAEQLWLDVMSMGKKYGFHNAQVTAIAPTGTIGLLMDCDTTGIEPDYALVKNKKLVGGGEVTIVNQAIEPALKYLGYESNQITKILDYAIKNNSLVNCQDLLIADRQVFACAMGQGALSPESHLLMMAAVQPFISGAISKTVNLPASATEKDVSQMYWQAWELGLKSVALYRDGSKSAQPLKAKQYTMKCPECGSDTELHSGCYRCPNCGFTVGCA